MKKGDLIFVYGTLRRGERMALDKYTYQSMTEFVAEDHINGLLYHLGSYPGVKLISVSAFDVNKAAVLGDVFRVLDPYLGFLLDAYEGYPHLYDREVVPTEAGRETWVYTYNHLVHDTQLIASGDWQNQIMKPSLQVRA